MSNSTPRCTPSRRAIAAAVAALGLVLTGCSASPDRFISGWFGPDRPVALVNRSLSFGDYRIGYTIELLVAPQGPPVEVTCGVVDTTGRIAFFDSLDRTVESGRWVTIEAEGDFDLPDLTLGLRCAPDGTGLLDVIVRRVSLDVEPL